MPSVGHHIVVGKDETVRFASLLLAQTENAGMGPIDNVTYLSVETNRTTEGLALKSGGGTDQAVLFPQRHQRTGLQDVVMAGQRAEVARIKIIIPSHHD